MGRERGIGSRGIKQEDGLSSLKKRKNPQARKVGQTLIMARLFCFIKRLGWLTRRQVVVVHAISCGINEIELFQAVRQAGQAGQVIVIQPECL